MDTPSPSIVEELQTVLSEQQERQTADARLEGFIKAAEQFEEMVKKGLTTKRGYTLLTIDQAHLKQQAFNRASQGPQPITPYRIDPFYFE